jgi:hypothetical protein
MFRLFGYDHEKILNFCDQKYDDIQDQRSYLEKVLDYFKTLEKPLKERLEISSSIAEEALRRLQMRPGGISGKDVVKTELEKIYECEMVIEKRLRELNEKIPESNKDITFSFINAWEIDKELFKGLLNRLSDIRNTFISKKSLKDSEEIYNDFNNKGDISKKINWLSSWAAYHYFYRCLDSYGIIDNFLGYDGFFERYFLFHGKAKKADDVVNGCRKKKSFENDKMKQTILEDIVKEISSIIETMKKESQPS